MYLLHYYPAFPPLWNSMRCTQAFHSSLTSAWWLLHHVLSGQCNKSYCNATNFSYKLKRYRELMRYLKSVWSEVYCLFQCNYNVDLATNLGLYLFEWECFICWKRSVLAMALERAPWHFLFKSCLGLGWTSLLRNFSPSHFPHLPAPPRPPCIEQIPRTTQ